MGAKARGKVDDDWDDDEWDEEDEESEDEDDEPAPKQLKLPKRSHSGGGGRTKKWDEKIRQYIRDKSHDELVDLVISLVCRFDELRKEFQERIMLGEGDAQRLIAQARRELKTLTSEIGWQNPWSDEGYTPDYDRFLHRLERLVELGHADAVAELGKEFIKCAMQQIEESNDEGETGEAVSECLPVIFEAVKKSSLSPVKKILFAIDAHLADDYDVVNDDASKLILGASWSPKDWSAVADELRDRLQAVSRKKSDANWSRDYDRDRISNWLLKTLEKAGRKDELLPIYESEAQATASYDRLVRYLIEKRRLEDAERWAKEGIEKTAEKLPGIACSLADMLGDIAHRRKQWDLAAARVAAQFFEEPNVKLFEELVALATKAKCADKVRAQALRFLETGVPPIAKTMSSKSAKGSVSLHIDPGWPLPVPNYLVTLLEIEGRTRKRGGDAPQPRYDVLVDLAIAEKCPDDVLHWYDKMRAEKKLSQEQWRWYGESDANRVAEAVTQSHPDRALAIYRQNLDKYLPQANPNAYEAAGRYLQKMRPVMKSLGRESEWKILVAEIREKYRNRPRFMEVLGKLEGRTVSRSQKQKARRHR